MNAAGEDMSDTNGFKVVDRPTNQQQRGPAIGARSQAILATLNTTTAIDCGSVTAAKSAQNALRQIVVRRSLPIVCRANGTMVWCEAKGQDQSQT